MSDLTDLQRAEKVLAKRAKLSGPTFKDSRRAVDWWLHMRERLSSPMSMHPRTEPGPNGTRVRVVVDGGKGGDLDEVLSTVTDIGTAMRLLHVDMPVHYHMLLMSIRDGASHTEIAKKHACSHGTVSNYLGKAEAYLRGYLAHSGIIS